MNGTAGGIRRCLARLPTERIWLQIGVWYPRDKSLRDGPIGVETSGCPYHFGLLRLLLNWDDRMADNGVDFDVVVIGAGVSGLTAARQAKNDGLSVCVLEQSEVVGGRVRTDHEKGFLLDRGFQVLLTGYPEAQRWLDYSALRLHRFEPGALVRVGRRFHRFVDPWRRPKELLSAALSPVASLRDKIKIARLRQQVCQGTLEDLYQRPEQTTAQALRDCGFSDGVLERFFRPFLGGIFLERDLHTSSRMFEFVFRMFSIGDAALPRDGMKAIPAQLANELSEVLTETRVVDLKTGQVQLADGRSLTSRATIVAAGVPQAQELLSDQSFPRRHQGVACLYYAADKPPIEEPMLVLNGDGQGPINNLCVPSQVAPSYAPSGSALISVTSLNSSGRETLERAVREHLTAWFGGKVSQWKHLRTDWIPFALPAQGPPALSPVIKSSHAGERIYVCGDHRHTASLQGAMESGRLAAQAVAADLNL